LLGKRIYEERSSRVSGWQRSIRSCESIMGCCRHPANVQGGTLAPGSSSSSCFCMPRIALAQQL
jgi:hypothetical protein